jgi:predicted helicase
MADYFQLDGEPLLERSSKWLNDDAIRFLRLAQWKIEQTGEGIAALVLPHTGLEAPTFRGLRRSLLDSFDEIYALDLHGNQRKREKSPDGGTDENVFRGIAQGVALFVLVKRQGLAKRVLRADLHGTRQYKLRTLAATHVDTTGWEEVHPRPTAYLFTSVEDRLELEYRRGVPLPEIFPVSTSGVITGRDGMATDLDWKSLVAKLGALRQTDEPEAGLDIQRWEALRGDERWPRRVLSFLARPFDHRYLFYAHYFLERPRQAVMTHMENGGNLALLASRQTRGEPGALVTRWIAGHKAVSAYDVSTLFPLYLYPEGMPGKRGRDPLLRRPNLAPALLASLAERYGEVPSPEEVLGYVYAVLYDPTYRSRYKKLLREDFPRIPFPQKRGAFHHLAALGAELIGLHLLADPRLLDPPVGLVGDACQPLGPRPRSFLRYWEDEGRLYVNPEDLGFEGISPEVQRYDIGGHPVLRRWLRSRCGRVLLPEEILTFRRIASALAFTLEVQAKIAEAGSGLGEAS